MKRSRLEADGGNQDALASSAKHSTSEKHCATALQPIGMLPTDTQRTIPPVPGSWARYYNIIKIRNVLGQSGLNQEWRVSPNNMCVLGLSSTHAAFANGRRPVEVAFNPDLHVEFSGKKKKGAMHLEPTASICDVKCTDGSTYTVYSGIRSSLMEINESLSLTGDQSLRPEGYLAILKAEPSQIRRLRAEELRLAPAG